MTTGPDSDDEATDELHRLLMDADAATVVPPGLWDRVRAPKTVDDRPERRGLLWRRRR